VKTAVIILGHGSKNSRSGDPLRQVAGEVKKHGLYDIVEYAFLQHCDPTPQNAIETCVRKNAAQIVIVPFFMQPGAHVARDIPALVEKAQKQFASVKIIVTDYAGAHPLMTKIVMDLIATSISGTATISER